VLELVRRKIEDLDRTLADLTDVRRGLRELLMASSRSARRGEAARLPASRPGRQSSTAGPQQGGPTMPHYEFYCERCKKEVDLSLSISERERGEYQCPGCGGKKLQPRLGTFFSQTSRKA
jgi:putative FmdB family regulatory protein